MLQTTDISRCGAKVRVTLPLVSIACTFFVGGCSSSSTYDPLHDVYTGEVAMDRILGLARSQLIPSLRSSAHYPNSAREFYLFDGGTFSGSITYWTFECGNPSDCLEAVRALCGIEASQMVPWKPSNYATATDGPAFYFPRLESFPWLVRDIKDGLVYEDVHDRSMKYCAVDLARNRVYFYRESGRLPK
jgi:hypothetical protein